MIKFDFNEVVELFGETYDITLFPVSDADLLQYSSDEEVRLSIEVDNLMRQREEMHEDTDTSKIDKEINDKTMLILKMSHEDKYSNIFNRLVHGKDKAQLSKALKSNKLYSVVVKELLEVSKKKKVTVSEE